jgi:hypothetical protein
MEEWKKIEGYEGIYEVSNKGRCRSLDRVAVDKNGLQRTLKGRMLQPKAQISGHLSVHLCKNGQPKQLLLHRIVGFAFLQGHFDGACIRHLDGDCRNNSVENLSWGTFSENSKDMYHAHGKRVGLKSHFSKYTKEEIDAAVALKGKMSSSKASKITGISRRYISELWSGGAGFQKAQRLMEAANAFTG